MHVGGVGACLGVLDLVKCSEGCREVTTHDEPAWGLWEDQWGDAKEQGGQDGRSNHPSPVLRKGLHDKTAAVADALVHQARLYAWQAFCALGKA